MEGIKGRLGAAAVLAGAAVLGAGCTANPAAPATGHTSPAAAHAPAPPDPFTITARYTARSLGLHHPDALAISPDGNLYVTDASQRVTVISPAGKVLRQWGKHGTRPGEFQFIAIDPTTPTDVAGKIAVGPDGKVYVSDSGNGRVQVFTPDGRFIRQLGSFGSGKGQFIHPFDLAADGAGNVYIADAQTETLTKFSPAGTVIWTIGGGASTDPDLNGHFHFTSFDAHGRLVVVNDDQNRVLYVDPSGHKVDAFSPSTSGQPGGYVCEATADAAGNTFLSGCGTDAGPTLVYNRAHRLIAKWPGTRYSLLRSPVFGPQGEVFALATDGSILRLHITVPGG